MPGHAHEQQRAGMVRDQPPDTWWSRPSQNGARSLNFCNFPVAVQPKSHGTQWSSGT